MPTKTILRSRWSILLGLSMGLLLEAGCDSSEGSTTVSSQVLSGKIGGKAWTFVQGETDAFLSDGETFFVTLYPSAFTACGLAAQPMDVGSLILSVPKTPGGYDMSLQRNATFYVPPSDNLVATKGRIEVHEVTATTVTGGASFSYNSDNSVDGQFQATICP